jgi:hypothetical protein
LRTEWERGNIKREHEHEVNPGLALGSRENYLYFIMTCSLNFQRVSPNTWKSALATWNDPETNFVFFPEKVVVTDVEQLRVALLKHKLALQPNKHTAIWQTISHTWHTFYDDDPRMLIQAGGNDVLNILEIVRVTRKKDFPYLSGPKLSNYFLFILMHYSDIQLKNIHEISIIPDTHIMKATGQLGLVPSDKLTPDNVEAAWKALLKETDYSPVDFHSILWNWSRAGFQPGV